MTGNFCNKKMSHIYCLFFSFPSIPAQCVIVMPRERIARSRWSKKRKNKLKWKGFHTQYYNYVKSSSSPKSNSWLNNGLFSDVIDMKSLVFSPRLCLCGWAGRFRRRSWGRTILTSISLFLSWGVSTVSGTSAGWLFELASMRKTGLKSKLTDTHTYSVYMNLCSKKMFWTLCFLSVCMFFLCVFFVFLWLHM